METIRAISGDSLFIEPEDLWRSNLPATLAKLMPRSERSEDGEFETVFVDGQTFTRKLPSSARMEFFVASNQSEGISDVEKRIIDLDNEGIWGRSSSHRSGCGTPSSARQRPCGRQCG